MNRRAPVVLDRRDGKVRDDRGELLFVSPVLPDDGGNGLAMRGALFLRAFTRDWNVRLLVLDVFGVRERGGWPAATDGCAEIAIIRAEADPRLELIASIPDPAWRAAALAGYPLPRLAGAATAAATQALGCLQQTRFARVHVFRLYMAPLVAPLLGRARTSLDLDDDDARTAASLAPILAARGRLDEARVQQAESPKWARLAADWAPRFDAVSLAAPDDAERLGRTLPGVRTACIPNAVRMARPLPPAPAGPPYTLLFVGTMGYAPNVDAALLLAREVLPALRSLTSTPLRLILAGGPAGELQALAGTEGVVVTGRVEDLRPLYAQSHVVLAPLRAGGGTRIKILEAMAHGRPVVATALGAAGLEAVDGEHLLISDHVPGLAAACRRLLGDPLLAQRLAVNGRALVARRYSRAVVTRAIRRL
ncbi:MAG: glycosyltransferase family 4 protein [Geminicoccaceae bacterium]